MKLDRRDIKHCTLVYIFLEGGADNKGNKQLPAQPAIPSVIRGDSVISFCVCLFSMCHNFFF